VVLADDHVVVRKGLCSLLNDEDNIRVIGEASDGRQAIATVQELNPDVLVVDVSMPLLNGLEVTRQIQKLCPAVRVVVLTMHDTEQHVLAALRAGAFGYVLKQSAPEELVLAIRAAFRGEPFLSPSVSRRVIDRYVALAGLEGKEDRYDRLTEREREILQLVVEGHSNREIVELLSLSAKTVENHKAHLMAKLDVRNMAELVQYAIRRGVVSAD
jgi:two-component system, NarL family, response regulator NreC